ncbi:SAF domain-containing protein [Occultella kanbiaonis]|uniref:SAF domain-containing protein n=1 Tax=Occultella kanbiaonis TaxID=2675754 RepID=UPI0012B7B436|nr:SAF domain-containing protein [Occultella kanbiaonis]
MLALTDLRPPAPPTTDVLVVTGTLPAGSVLTAADLEVRQVRDPPPETVPLAEAVGAPLTIGVSPGMPVVPTLLVGPGLAAAAPADTVVVPIRLADPALAQLVRVGDLLDLYLAPVDSGGQVLESELITSGALVLSRVDAQEADASLFAGTAPAATGVVIAAVAAQDAARVSGASAVAPFRAVLVDRD